MEEVLPKVVRIIVVFECPPPSIQLSASGAGNLLVYQYHKDDTPRDSECANNITSNTMRWMILWFTATLVTTVSAIDLGSLIPLAPKPDEAIRSTSDEIVEGTGTNPDEQLNSSPSSATGNSIAITSRTASSEVTSGTTSREIISALEADPDNNNENDDVADDNVPEIGEASPENNQDSSNDAQASNEPIDLSVSDKEDLIIQTKSGPVQGYMWQDKENIISFIDIPYGTIDNPFQVATATKTWEPIHDVKEHAKRCPQLNNDEYNGDIDCLTLSIFKPIDAKDASVLFHIHADNFNAGSGDPSIYGPEYLVSNGIILVLPNYRLGPLGFICMQNQTAPGNMALKDLSLALNWVHDNIEAFGGKPDNIAVSGDGKSGALAGLLSLSPMSKDYVSKVIAESGSFLSYWALDRDPATTAAELFEKMTEAEGSKSRGEISFSELIVEEIVTAAKGIAFRPCLETDDEVAFMQESPYVTVSNEKIEISFLVGSATYAGVHEALLQTEDSINKLNEDFTVMLPDDLIFSTPALRRNVGQTVKTQYFGDDAISLDDVEELSLCFTDMGYLGPGIRSSRLLVESGATVYFYEFAFVGEFNRELEIVNRPFQGAVRGDIVGYLFTQDGAMPDEKQTAESKIIDALTQMWTNFLKNGNPSTETIEWNKLESKDEPEEEWLLIDSEPVMKKGIHVNRLALWTEIYNEHFIDGNHGRELSPSVYTVLLLQLVFWLTFCRNASHVLS